MSLEHKLYLRKIALRRIFVILTQIIILIGFFVLWELSARLGFIDPFIFSMPSRMFPLFIEMMASGQLPYHIWITTMETVAGFAIGTVLGVMIALLLWSNDFCRQVFNPYLIIFNSLPKTALAPIIIVWVGNNIRAVIVIALLISIVVTILNVLTGFLQVEEEKIRLAKSFSANKLQILSKVVLPASMPSIMNALKVNVGLSFVGVIVGEFLVARAGLGFLIVHGSQIFRMDMVMLSIIILCILAALMYQLIAFFEILLNKRMGG